MSHEPLVIVDQALLDGAPARAISYLQPEQAWESGFMVFAGEPDEEIDTALVCIHRLLDERGELGRGMDLARRRGEALHKGSTWIAC
jgi:hypothetical protein